MDIITNKPAKAPLIELFPDNNITVRLLFPDGYNMSGLEAKIYRKLDNTIISDVSKQPEILVEDQLLSVVFTSDNIKLLSAPFILYIYDNDAAIISFDCITSNKSGEYQDVTTQVVIGNETIVVINAQLNPASGISKEEADLLYYSIDNPNGYISDITSLLVTNALGYVPVSLSGSYADPSWITSLSKSKVGLSNVLNVAQEPAIAGGTTAQYWRGDKTWVAFPTIPTNNNQLTNGSNYITASSTDVLTNKTGNISQWTNNSGYLTSASLTGYATETFVSSGYSPLGHTHTFASLTSKPTTLSGYGITDAYTKTEIDGFSFTTASNTQTFINKSGNISQWTNNSGYLTGINSSQVTTALGYTPVNPNGTNAQYISGDGSKITFPTIPTNANYADLTTNQSVGGIKTLLDKLVLATGSTTLTPLQFTSGALNTTPVVGAVEFLTDRWYGVITNGAARKEFVMTDTSPLTVNRIPYVGANGRLVDNSGLLFSSTIKLSLGTSSTTATLNIAALTTSTGVSPLAIFTGAPHTNQTASTELLDIHFDLNRTVQFATGAKTTQRAFLISAPTYSAVGSTTITTASTFSISGAPTAGTNVSITTPYAFWVQAGNSRFAGDLSIGGNLSAAATNFTNVSTAANISIGTTLSIGSAPVYADNAAATTGGLTVGSVYKTSTGTLMIRY